MFSSLKMGKYEKYIKTIAKRAHKAIVLKAPIKKKSNKYRRILEICFHVVVNWISNIYYLREKHYLLTFHGLAVF